MKNHVFEDEMDEFPYLSTACLHEVHDKCRKTCKFCEAPCQCPCHEEKK